MSSSFGEVEGVDLPDSVGSAECTDASDAADTVDAGWPKAAGVRSLLVP
eukprot:COSAG02_NODE_19966_length_855_cov_1.120370_1_plen_49_part_00